MKRILFFFFMFFSSISGIEAQENIYIYRNDGMFHAFSKNEVDSIEYSKYDENGVLGDEWKMQLVYTADSIYSIPLAAIDSVSFYAPQTILNNDVFMLTASHDQYLSNADTLSFILTSTTPNQMIPKKGNIVFSTVDCLSFEHGIMARIISVQKVADGLKFDCEKVALDDIYAQIVAYCELSSNDDFFKKSQKCRATDATSEKKFTLWNKNFDNTLEKGGTKTDYGVSDAASAKFTVCKILGKPLSVTLEFENHFESNVKFNATSSVGQYYAKKLGKTINCGRIPIPNTGLWIVPQLDLYAYFEEVGKISLDFAAHLNRTDKFIIKYCDKKWSTAYKPVTDAGIDVASLSMKGYAEIGVNPQILFSLCGSKTGIGVNYKVGLRENIDFEFDAIKLFDSGAYEALKNSCARTTMPQEFSVFAQAGLIDINDTHRYEHKPLAWETLLGNDKYLLPEFSNLAYSLGNEKKTVVLKADIKRDLLFPVAVGIGIYDESDNLVSSKYNTLAYSSEKNWNFQGITETFNNLQAGVKYTAYPMVKILSKELRATPKKEIYTETNGMNLRIVKKLIDRAKYEETYHEYDTNKAGQLSDWCFDYHYYEDPECSILYHGIVDFGTNSFEISFSDGSIEADQLLDFKYSYGVTKEKAITPDPRNYWCATTGPLEMGFDISDCIPNIEYTCWVEVVLKDKIYVDSIKFTPIGVTETDFVDMGTGVLWKSCNYGASFPEEFGQKSLFPKDEENSCLKLPSWDDFKNLCQKCKFTVGKYKGNLGVLFHAENGNSLFFPCYDNSEDGWDKFARGRCYYITKRNQDDWDVVSFSWGRVEGSDWASTGLNPVYRAVRLIKK